MKYKIVASTVFIIGIIALIYSLLQIFVFSEEEVIQAKYHSDIAQNKVLIFTEYGVLDLISRNAQISIDSSPETNIALAIGETGDINGFCGKMPRITINGLKTWSELSTSDINYGQDNNLTYSAESSNVNSDNSLNTLKTISSDMWFNYKTANNSLNANFSTPTNASYSTLVFIQAPYGQNIGNVDFSLNWSRQNSRLTMIYTTFFACFLIILSIFITVISSSRNSKNGHFQKRRNMSNSTKGQKFNHFVLPNTKTDNLVVSQNSMLADNAINMPNSDNSLKNTDNTIGDIDLLNLSPTGLNVNNINTFNEADIIRDLGVALSNDFDVIQGIKIPKSSHISRKDLRKKPNLEKNDDE